jgi:hypothetical protein
LPLGRALSPGPTFVSSNAIINHFDQVWEIATDLLKNDKRPLDLFRG